jgi:hypothetical protein
MAYYTNAGPESGPLHYRDAPEAIGVLNACDGEVTVGMARKVGWDLNRVAVWRLTVYAAELSGSWIVVDREFRPAR